MLIEINAGTMYYGANDVFNNIDFKVNENEKIALIGRNGSGKTTLLKVLLGEEELQSGQVFKNNKLNISYLKQNALIDSHKTVKDEILEAFSVLIEMEKNLKSLTIKLENSTDDKLISEYTSLEEKFKLLGGYSYEAEMMSVLKGFGFNQDDLNREVYSFSGGEKTKLAFAKLLLSKPDLLLLDEPTNHLDLKTIEWLENYLAKYKKAIVLVSHDRVFLDKVCNVTYELEYGSIKRYGGNYSYYAKTKKNDFERQEKAFKRQQKDIRRLEELIEKFRYKKNKAAFAQSKIKYLERLEKVEDPKKADTKSFKAKFYSAIKGGKSVLTLKDFEFGYNHPFGKVNLEIQRGDRICIMGDNGTGKSTLLKTIIGEIKELNGYKMFGHQIDIAYFDQNMVAFTSGNNVLDEIWNDYPELSLYEVRSVLGSFLFTSDEVFKDVSVLSGGEKVRLLLAKLMMKHANFLILDEPTNHLDIVSKEALEDSLKDFDGTILFVSHDRYFIKEIVSKVLLIDNNEITLFSDGYKDYIDTNKDSKTVNNDDHVKENVIKLKDLKNRPKYNISKLEEEISKMEELLEEKRDLRFEPEYYQDSSKMQELDNEIDDIHNKIHALEEKWAEAMEFEENKSKA